MTTCFATTPVTSLSQVNLSYTPPATVLEPNPVEASRDGGTGSGFDTAMRDGIDGSMSTSGNLSYVPVWWYTVMAISSGTNNAVRAGLRNADSDMRVIEDMARNATIEDPRLLKDIQRFYNECFIPARSIFLAMNKNDLSPAGRTIIESSNTRNGYGPTDTEWIGSQLFRTENGFYDTMRSKNPVTGFAIDYSRDTDYPPAGADAPDGRPDWGRPTCKQWWEDGAQGIRREMISQSDGWDKLSNAMNNGMFASDDLKLDALARMAQFKAKPTFTGTVGNEAYDSGTKFIRGLSGTVGAAGILATGTVASVTVGPLMVAMPLMQALLLMGLYMFLPLVVFFSGFDLRAMFYGAVGIFTVKLWAAMWFIAQWIDARMIKAMYPGNQLSSFIMQDFTYSSDGGYQSEKRILLNILMNVLFVGLPILWTVMMTWVGINVGSQLNKMIADGEGVAKKAADEGITTATNATKGAMK
jgi:hypothetical protein